MFVTNRIELIRDHTDIHQWHYVGTKDNLADYSSRGIDVMTKMFKNGFEDHLFCGKQKQSGLFKITKEGFYRMIQK